MQSKIPMLNFSRRPWHPQKENDFLGYFYILQCTDCLKIGSTQRPERRLQELKRYLQNYGKRKVVAMYISPICSNYKDNEQCLHEKMKDDRIGKTELFLSPLAKTLRLAKQLEIKDESKQLQKEADKGFETLKSLFLDPRW